MAKVQSVKGNWESANKHNAYLIDLVTGEYLGLMGLPRQMDYENKTAYATIAVPGRNNPHYHFTGSEDTLSFEISWWSEEDGRRDVIKKCKWVESMSKADGYNADPHLLRFKWGEMFSKATWKVESVTTVYTQFHRERGYMPCCAVQTITLKRVTLSNTTLEQINDWRF